MARIIPPLRDDFGDGQGFPDDSLSLGGVEPDYPESTNEYENASDDELFEDEEEQNEDEGSEVEPDSPIGSGGDFSGFGNSGTTQEDVFAIISGKNEIPADLKKEFFPLLASSIQYNNVQSRADLALWGIRTRGALRKYQMSRPEAMVDSFTQSQIEYCNALNFNRAILGFERKMSVTNLSGIMNDQKLDTATNGKKKGFLAGLFGR